MDAGRRSIRAGSGFFSPVALEPQHGRRETGQHAGKQTPVAHRGSVRNSYAGNRVSTASSRQSRSSTSRASVRGVRTGVAADSSGQPFDRIACIDAQDGRDRTPKPLLAPRLHADLLQTAGWGGGEGLGGSGRSSTRSSTTGGGGPMLGVAIPSARSLLNSEASEVPLDASALPPGMRAPGRESMQGGGSRQGMFLAGLSQDAMLQRLTSAAASARGSIAVPGAATEGQQEGAHAAVASVSEAMVELARTESHHPAAGFLAANQDLQQRHQPPLPQQGAEQPGKEQCRMRGLRSKPTQCTPVVRVSRGVQVLARELRGISAAPAGAGDGGVGTGPSFADGALGGAAEVEGLDAADEQEDEEAALLALQRFGGGGGGGGGGSNTRRGTRMGAYSRGGSGMHSQASSRRESVADSSRMSSMSGAGGGGDWSQPSSAASSRRTSMADSDWSGRESGLSRRTSFAAFMAGDGRASVLGTPAGLYPPGSSRGGRHDPGRASVLSVGQGHGGRRGTTMAQVPSAAAPLPPPQLTAEQLAAAAARRERAAQERALARLPDLLGKLQAADKAVLLNQRHAQLAQYHGVQLCRVAAMPHISADPSHKGTPDAAAAAETSFHPCLSPGRERQATTTTDEAPPVTHRSGSTLASARAYERQRGLQGLGSSVIDSSRANTPPQAGSLSSRQPVAPELPLLWVWRSELTGQLPVSCLAWSKAAPGLLAVGYGRLQYEVSGGVGMVAVWSLANPTHPQWHAATTCGVSALDWSSKSPGTLAAGSFDGSVAIYDVSAGSKAGAGSSRAGGSEPLARGSGSVGSGHSEPVWQLRYVPRATDPGEEMLVSISSDGRVLEWKHAQGLERVELLRLKRQQRGAAGGAPRRLHVSSSGGTQAQAGATGSAVTQGLLGQSAGGTCFDFSAADPRTYLVGTEEGAVHKCSTAFSEQYIQSYSGHLAPVYQVCFSPFSPTHFLTCSADWSVRLWSEGQPRSLWTFQLPSARAEVVDVAFSPRTSTVFAAAAGNSLHLWDLQRSVLAPRAVATQPGVLLTALAFPPAEPVVVTGAEDGTVSVYSLAVTCEEAVPVEQEEQRQRLEAALQQHMARHISS